MTHQRPARGRWPAAAALIGVVLLLAGPGGRLPGDAAADGSPIVATSPQTEPVAPDTAPRPAADDPAGSAPGRAEPPTAAALLDDAEGRRPGRGRYGRDPADRVTDARALRIRDTVPTDAIGRPSPGLVEVPEDPDSP